MEAATARVTDSHAHLDACDEDAADPRRARARGRRHADRHDRDRDRLEPRGARDRRGERGCVRGARDRSASGCDARGATRSTSFASCSRIPKAVAVGETGLDTVRRFATPEQQRRLFDAHLALADELELPVVIHNREADDETAAALAPFGGTVVLHCFSSPGLVEIAVERGYYVSFAGNVTYPNAAVAARGRGSDSARPDPRRDGQPVPRATAGARRRRTSRPTSSTRSGCSPTREARPSRSSRPRRTRTRPLRSDSRDRRAQEGARSALPRRREHPRRHRAPERSRARRTSSSRSARASACSRATSPTACGSSTRSRSIARSSRRCAKRSAARSNVVLIVGRRTRRRRRRARPRPDEARRQPPVQRRDAARRRDARARDVARALVRDGAARGRRSLLRAPRTKAYGAVSVLVQLSARKTGFHPVPPTVFRPRPRVDSALVAFERAPIAPIADVRPVVEAAFAHRRKTLANSLAHLRARARDRASRKRSPRSGIRRTRAPRSSSRAEFVQLAELLAVSTRQGLREDQPRARRRAATRRRQARGRHRAPAHRPPRRHRARAGGRARRRGLRRGHDRSRRALESLADAAGVEPRWRVRIEKRIPVAAGLGGGSSDAATALLLANATLAEPLDADALHRVAARIGADVPFFLRDGAQLATGDGTELAPVVAPDRLPRRARRARTARRRSRPRAVYAAFDARGGADGFAERAASLRAALASIATARDLATLPRERPRVVSARTRAR